MAGRGSGAQTPGASLGVGPINSGGTTAITDGFHTPLGADPFKKSSAMARLPEKRVKCSGRQPGTSRRKKQPKSCL